MKKIFIFLALFLFLVIPQIISEVHADGAFFSNRHRHLFEPEQKAIIVWDGRTESILLSAKVSSEHVSDLSRLVWLIPIESSQKPEVNPGNISLFKTFVDYFAPEIGYGQFGAAAGVKVLEMKEIDIYDIAIRIMGPDRILFGSDFPLIKFRRYMDSIKKSVKSRKDREKILGGNAALLLNIK